MAFSLIPALLPLLGLLGLSSSNRSSAAHAQFPAANANRRRSIAPTGPEAARQRAAVDAAVTRVIREETHTTSTIRPGTLSSPASPSSPAQALIKQVKAKAAKRKAVAAQTAKTADILKRVKAAGKPKPAPPPSSPARTAALRLRDFLQRTKRFGTKQDKPGEVFDAQRGMGIKADGIVGPATRAKAKSLGVALPAR